MSVNIRAIRTATAMRALGAAAVCLVLGGCWTSAQEAASNRSGDQFVGQSVDAVVARLGKPTGRKSLDNDEMSYVWELPPIDWSGNRNTQTGDAGLYGDGHTPGYMSDDPRMCRISVTTSREGIVTQFNAEDTNGTGAPSMTLGLTGSVCAQRLAMKART
jgi:hypothetical protein